MPIRPVRTPLLICAALVYCLPYAALAQSMTVTQPFEGVRWTLRSETQPRPLSIRVAEIDLDDPGVSFRMTGPGGSQETQLQQTVNFVEQEGAQLGVNVHFFTNCCTSVDGGDTGVLGLGASEGVIYSPFEAGFPAFNISADNEVRFFGPGEFDPASPPADIWNAGAGSDFLVQNGENVAPTGTTGFEGVNPRTAIGHDADTNTLVLVTVDGRQPGFSEGVTLVELADLMLQYGVETALNLDGGGSTTMVVNDPNPIIVNSPSGSPRANGSNLAVFAVPVDDPGEATTFEQGVGGYAGTVDKEIRSSGGDAANGQDPFISIDGDDATGGVFPNQGLIRFESILGTGAGQVDPSLPIAGAVLTLNVVNPGSGMSVHRMLVPWDETSTWSGLGGGVTLGVDAVSDPLVTIGAGNFSENIGVGELQLDVTAAVQAWAQGAPNHGLALLPLPAGDNGVDFGTSESATPPVLTIFTGEGIDLGENAFSIVALPDTQNYVTSTQNAPLFTQQTRWVADQIQLDGNPLNIAFVTHLGDVVSSGSSLTQYQRADTSLSLLDGGLPDAVIPWSVLPGNHDYASTGSKTTGTDSYLSFFGPQRFAGYSWFGGSEASGNNTYQFFTGGDTVYLHIALEWRPDSNVTNGPTRVPSPIEWAQSVIDANPGLPTIISTHEYVDDNPPGRSGSGQALWNRLVRSNDQVFMVLNGHYHSASIPTNDGEYHQVSLNDFGKPVIEVLQDYQDYPNGGDGWLRILTFEPGEGRIRFRTFTPVSNLSQTETVAQVGQFASQFAIPLDFEQRFSFIIPVVRPATDVIVAQGLGGYQGTIDKEIRSSGNDEANGGATSISVDGDDAGGGVFPNHGLIRFEDLFGPGNALPAGTPIDQAILSLNVVNPGSGFSVHPMIRDWDETTTWASLGGDGVTLGVDAEPTPIATFGAGNGSENVGVGLLDIDVSAIARRWADGSANFGLALIPFQGGNNGVDFTTSESSEPPVLTITVPDCFGDLAEPFDGVPNAEDVLEAIEQIDADAPELARLAAPRQTADFFDFIEALLRIEIGCP